VLPPLCSSRARAAADHLEPALPPPLVERVTQEAGTTG
jgi:hypothetical protein